MMQITTFKWVPAFAQGYVKDLCPRWAFEEIGAPYSLHLIGFDELHTDEFRRLQPFEQVPVLTDGSLQIFETGAILLHIGETSEKLLPRDPAARARARTWVISALASIEPFVDNFNHASDSKEEWGKLRLPSARENLQGRLRGLNQWLEGREFLESQFTVADIMMTMILRHLVDSGMMRDFPNVEKYHQRCEARPAFKKALADQMKTYADNAP